MTESIEFVYIFALLSINKCRYVLDCNAKKTKRKLFNLYTKSETKENFISN